MRLKSFWKIIAIGILVCGLTIGAFAATTPYQARVAITTTGTAVALGSAQEMDWIVIVADIGNLRPIVIGSSTVTRSEAATDGYRLRSGETVTLGPSDRAEIYINGLALDSVYYVAATGSSSVGWLFSVEMGVATTVVKASAGQLHGVLIETNGTNNVIVQFYNHASTATNPMTPSIVVAGGDRYGGAMNINCAFSLGCVIVLSGTGGVATVYYR